MFGGVGENAYLCRRNPHMCSKNIMNIPEFQDAAGRILATSRQASATIGCMSSSIYLRLCTRAAALDKQMTLNEIEDWARDLQKTQELLQDITHDLNALHRNVQDTFGKEVRA